MMTAIQKRLFRLQDKDYQAFSAKLNPTVDPETIIGIRIPALRALAKELKGSDEAAEFLSVLPHKYFEEYQLHAFLIGYEKDFDKGLSATERLLPYLNSWALTDSIRIKAFDKAPEKLLPHIEKWLEDDHPYTVRFGILCLMNYFLNDCFATRYPDMVAAVHSEEYYVRMMQAWYFATALAKQYDSVLPYLTGRRLEPWVHNKTIQKAVESYRVTAEQKAYLRTLKVK
ncbi:DNA alkylation repair protein [Ruminococcus difficilis]|uniref:DNA alkylation repair protein n=1 Tax=Ruminococcus difficilis TaxID=2763069 RepID=A0A934WU28_9FIRM|nr:DNA alkylation repair protein [Ruminococcus difficilis]MBK6089953.1 DNA alkylation repair protein [Ruminococcus difficilis]